MKISKLRLERFRRFSDTTFEFEDFNLLVGPNNSGKTSVLHALRAFFLLMHGHVRIEGNPPGAIYHRRFLTSGEEVAPTPDLKELWCLQQAGRPLKVTVTFEDGAAFSVVLRQQFGQIHVSAEDLPKGLTPKKLAKYFGIQVAFIPGLVGVLVQEPFATAARRDALATQGRYSEIFRSSLRQLKEKNPDALKTINKWLAGLFDVTVSTISFNPETDEYVTVKYKEGGVEFDVVSSGAGLQQVIQVLTYLYLSKPRLLLIDEPDAHLHSKLQARLGELFRRVAADLDAQVLLSTHSLDLIDSFSTDEVMVVDSRRKLVRSIGKNADLVSTLVEANVVDVSALSRLLASRRLVVIEDEDQTILKALDKAIGSPLYSSRSSCYVLPAKGVGNFRAVAELGRVLSSLTGSRFDIVFLQDRDGMPDFVVDAFMKSQAADGVRPELLGRHEIESYLVEPELMVAAGKRVGRKLTEKEAEAAVLQAAQTNKSAARRMSRETAAGVNKHLTGAAKWKDSTLEEEVDKWFDALDLRSLDVVRIVFPGKELLQEALKALNGDGLRQITRGQLVASLIPDLVCEPLRRMLGVIAAAATDAHGSVDSEMQTSPSPVVRKAAASSHVKAEGAPRASKGQRPGGSSAAEGQAVDSGRGPSGAS